MRTHPNPYGLATPNQDSPAANIAALVLLGSPPDIIINGDFAADSDWTKDANWTIGSGVATSDGNTGQLDQSVVLKAVRYMTVFKAVRAAGTIRIGGGFTVVGTARTASGTYHELLISTGSTGITFFSTSFNGTIDDVAVYDLGSDVTTDGSRQVIDRIDFAYSAAPSGGGLQIIDSTGVVFDLDVAEASPGPLKFGHGARGGFHSLPNKPLAVLLKPGGSGITGKLNVISR